VLFLLTTHSAFFRASKYGIIPKSFRPKRLSYANEPDSDFFRILSIMFGTIGGGAL